jgi:hypothetical protein
VFGSTIHCKIKIKPSTASRSAAETPRHEHFFIGPLPPLDTEELVYLAAKKWGDERTSASTKLEGTAEGSECGCPMKFEK